MRRFAWCGAVWWCALWPGMIVHGDVISASKPGAAVADPLRVSGDEPALVQAREALGRGDEAGCLAALEAALKAHPELPPAQLMLANLYLSNNQAVKGRAALERAAAALPDDPGVSLVCANLALAEGRLADAWVHYERALGLKAPEAWPLVRSQNLQAQCHAGMTSIAERRGDWPRARQHLEAWLALAPGDGHARQRLARALVAQGETDAALAQLRRAVADAPALGPADVALAWIYTQRGDLARAEAAMKEAVKALPGDRQTREAFALWLLQNDRPDEAKTEAEAAAAAVAPEVLKTLTYLQGLIARHRKDHAAAVRLFEAVLKESADDFAASNQLALALIESDDSAPRQRAQELAERNVQRQPKSAEALATLGWIYFRLGRVDAAERALSAATSGGDLSCDTAYYLAQILVQKGRIAEARAMIASAVKAPGRFTFRNDARAWLAQNQAAPQSGPTRP